MRRLLILAAGLGLLLRADSLLQTASARAVPRTNPYAGNADAVSAGGKIFAMECAACHGQNGTGRGRPRTPVLDSPSVRAAAPGALFWILRNGSASHRMPSFSQLPEEQRWQIVAFLQREKR